MSRQRGYALAVLAVGVAAGARLLLPLWISDTVPLLLFFAAIVAASWVGGFGPGVLATALATAAAYALIPVNEVRIGGGSIGASLLRFALVGVVIAWLNDRLVRARAMQQRSIDQLAAIVESSDDSILSIDREGVIVSWNRGAEAMYGYRPAEAIGRHTSIVVAPERRAEEHRFLERILTGGSVEQFDTERIRKDGTRIDVSVRMSPIRDAAGTIVGASKIARDISERRRADRMRDELLERERQARAEAVSARDRLGFLAEVGALLTSSLDYRETLDRAVRVALPRLGDYCNVLVEEEGRLRHVAWAHVVPEKEHLLQELVRQVTDAPPDRVQVPRFYDIVLKTAAPLNVPHEALARAAREVAMSALDPGLVKLGLELAPFAYVGAPLLLHGRAIGVISFGTGEHESRREYSDADVALVEEFARRVSPAIDNARLFRQADQLNRLKDEFLATLSHELRTPLSAILGWARMLAAGQLDADGSTRAVQAIERNAQAQSQIVEDILDLAHGRAGNLRLDLQPVDLGGVAQHGVEAIAPAAAAKRLVVDVHCGDSVTVVGDPGRLQQVAWNLLSNAVKFSDPGGRVAVEVAAKNGSAELRVADTGIGIAPEFLPHVFDKFRQADGSFSRKHGGLGLGLAIARHLVELHGGAIDAHSDGLGHGAAFIVRLPLASTAGPAERTALST